MQQLVVSGIRHRFRCLSQSEGQITHVLLTRSPLVYPPKGALPLDLHVLSTPPAFVLSQDQTLHRKPRKSKTRQSKLTTSKTTPPPKKDGSITLARIIIDRKTNTPTPKNRTGAHKLQRLSNTLLSSQTSHAHHSDPCGVDVGGNLRKLTGPRRHGQLRESTEASPEAFGSVAPQRGDEDQQYPRRRMVPNRVAVSWWGASGRRPAGTSRRCSPPSARTARAGRRPGAGPRADPGSPVPGARVSRAARGSPARP